MNNRLLGRKHEGNISTGEKNSHNKLQMFVFLFWTPPHLILNHFLSLSIFIFFNSFYSLLAVRGEHPRLCTISTQLTELRLLQLHPAVNTQGHVWSEMGSALKKGRAGRRECGRKRNLDWLHISLYIRTESGRETGMAGVRGCMCVFLLLCNK